MMPHEKEPEVTRVCAVSTVHSLTSVADELADGAGVADAVLPGVVGADVVGAVVGAEVVGPSVGSVVGAVAAVRVMAGRSISVPAA